MHEAVDGGSQALTELPEFNAFRAGIKDRCDELPVTRELTAGLLQPGRRSVGFGHVERNEQNEVQSKCQSCQNFHATTLAENCDAYQSNADKVRLSLMSK